MGPASFVITVIDYDTKQPVANAMVSLYDEFNAFIANLGFTDNSGGNNVCRFYAVARRLLVSSRRSRLYDEQSFVYGFE